MSYQTQLTDDAFGASAAGGAATVRPEGFDDRQDVLDDSAPEPPAEHLSATPPTPNVASSADPQRNEWWCTDDACHLRITVSGVDGRTEYGHARDCPHAIDRGTSQ